MQISLNKKIKPKNSLFKNYSSEKQRANTEGNTINNNSIDNKNIRKRLKYYSVNIRNKINKRIKNIQAKSRYKRNIFTLLYDQIHSDIKDIEKEITVAKNLILPYSFLKRNQIKNEIFINKRINQIDLKDIQIEEYSKKNDKNNNNLNIPKIHNLKNSFLSNTTSINSSERKDYNSNIFMTFSKTRNNNYIKSINIKSRNKPKLNIMKAVTENNNIMNDSIFNNDKNVKNINNVYSNTERNNLNNSFRKLSNDKNNTKTTLIKVNPEIKAPKRKKCLYVSYDEKWYLKNKYIYIKLDKLEIENNYIQSQIISDQYALVNENIKLITSKYLVDKELINKFNSTNNTNQQLININIEESISLMIEISYILLEEYEDNLENFVTQIIKRQKKDSYKLIDDEKKEFPINLTLFTETSSFLTVSYKSYLILLQKDENYKISKFNFDKIYQFLDRLRLSVNKIILDLNILYNGSNNKDKKIITECVKKIIKLKEQKNEFKKKAKLDCHQKFGDFRSGIDPFKYKGRLQLKVSEEKEIIMRINKAIGNKNNNEKTFDYIKKFDIGSKLVSDLMKYGTKEFREFIIYERIRQKFYEKNK